MFGGAPCQGFSLIGHRVLDDPRNRLILEFVRLTVELDARYFVFENVKGLTIGDHRRLLDELIEAFDEEGYNVVMPYRVLNAADFGVPQDRRRLFLMGAKKGLRLPKYPEGVAGRRTTVWQAIGDLPEAEQYRELIETMPLRTRNSARRRHMRACCGDLPRTTQDLSYPRKWDPTRLTSSMRTDHTPLSQRRFNRRSGAKRSRLAGF